MMKEKEGCSKESWWDANQNSVAQGCLSKEVIQVFQRFHIP
jgi:hypothetical protein